MASTCTTNTHAHLCSTFMVVCHADQVGGLVNEVVDDVIDRVVASDLGGLVESAAVDGDAVAAAKPRDSALTTDFEEQEEHCGPNGGFYQAVVELRTIILPRVNNETVEETFIDNDERSDILLNGDPTSESYEEEIEEEQTEYETEIDLKELNEDDSIEERTEYETEAIEEDLDTDEYTFVEISVYEVQEVSEQVKKCEIEEVIDLDKTALECVAVLTEVNNESDVKESVSKDDVQSNEIEDSDVVECLDESISINNSATALPLNNGSAKRKRGRGHSQTRRRRNRHRK